MGLSGDGLFTKRLSFPELVVENGSGLSRIERISGYNMGELLVRRFTVQSCRNLCHHWLLPGWMVR